MKLKLAVPCWFKPIRAQSLQNLRRVGRKSGSLRSEGV